MLAAARPAKERMVVVNILDIIMVWSSLVGMCGSKRVWVLSVGWVVIKLVKGVYLEAD